MLRYQPPKSNVWGHSLRGLAPSKQRRLFDAFCERALAGIGRRSASLTVQRLHYADAEPSSAIAEFESILGRSSRNGRFELSDGEREAAIEALIRKEREFLDLPYALSLWDSLQINAWRIQGRASDTQSTMVWVYGTQPRICTMLRFVSRDEFYYVQEVLGELGVCRLSEKHLKEMKRGLKTA